MIYSKWLKKSLLNLNGLLLCLINTICAVFPLDCIAVAKEAKKKQLGCMNLKELPKSPQILNSRPNDSV